jgi:hypothetical protein
MALAVMTGVVMAELSGELIAYPLPNQPGWWAYRELSNGVLLLVELNKEEWSQLHEQHRQKEQDKIRDLDKHPLNLAARTVLEQAREYPLHNEISLISLGRFAFDEDVPDWNDAFMAFNDWALSPGTMQKAIWVMEEAKVTPEDFLSLTLEDAAQLVLEHLG